MKILNKDIADETIHALCTLIKKKKELRSVADVIVIPLLVHTLKKSKKDFEQIIPAKRLEKSAAAERVIKHVRAVLREKHGMFHLALKDAKKCVDALKDIDDLEGHKKILAMHASTKERLPFYHSFYKRIWEETTTPKTLLDLGCGMNPFSYPFLGCKPAYIAVDIDEKECNLIAAYFRKMRVQGTARVFDVQVIKTTHSLATFPPVDVCFALKLLDTLEAKKGHTRAEMLIKAINASFIIVSFSTKTVSGKDMRHPERGWIERMLTRLGVTFKKIRFSNEIVYIIKKSGELHE